MAIVAIALALIIDQLLGEPKRFHPLVGFGNCALLLEKKVNRVAEQKISVLFGFICVLLLITPWISLSYFIVELFTSKHQWLFDCIVLYWAIGLRSIQQHLKPIEAALATNDIISARQQLSRIVSRDTDNMTTSEITKASIETTLENGNDALFGVLFCYLIGGAPGVIAYRLINTLDAMWGYRTARFEYFGKAAAILDDVLNYIPARLTACSYILAGNFRLGVRCWLTQSHRHASPNAGPVMTAGAGSLNLQLGGDAYYHKQLEHKALFGGSRTPNIADIRLSLRLVQHCTIIWCGVLAVAYLIGSVTV